MDLARHPHPEHAKAVHEAEHAVDHAWEVYHRAALGGTVASPALQAEIEQSMHEARTLVAEAQEAAERGDKRQVQRLVGQIKIHTSHVIEGGQGAEEMTLARSAEEIAAIVATAYAVAQSPVLAAAPAPAPVSKELDPVPMVTIPAGEFLMGNSEGKGRADEGPQRSVYLDAFAIDQVEVTNERYMVFVATTGHRTPPNPYGKGPLLSVKSIEQLPVVQTTWYDAKAYCSWAKKRLPTEAEWEKTQTRRG